MKKFRVRSFVVVDYEIDANSKSDAYTIAKEIMKDQETKIDGEFIELYPDIPNFKDIEIPKDGYVILNAFVDVDEYSIKEIEIEDDVKDVA